MVELFMCRACLKWESKMHQIENTELQELFEKLTDSKLDSDRMPKVLCYVCYTQLQKCCRFVGLSKKAGQVLSEFILQSNTLSKESDVNLSTHNILNVQMGNCYSNYEDEVYQETLTLKDELVLCEEEIGIDELGVIDNIKTEDAVADELFDYSINSNDCPETSTKKDIVNRANKNERETEKNKIIPIGQQNQTNNGACKKIQIDRNILNQDVGGENFHVEKDPLHDYKYSTQTVSRIIERKIVNSKTIKLNYDINKTNSNSLNPDLLDESDFDVLIENPIRSEAYKNNPGPSPESTNFLNKPAVKIENIPSKRGLTGLSVTGTVVGSSNEYSLNLFYCDICGKSFTRKTELQKHTRKIHSENFFPCNFCSKSFVIKSDYERHSRIVHTVKRPFTCDHCDKSYNQRGVLLRHMKIHTGKKPYVCSECNRRFTDKSTLSRHMIIHSEKHQFNCTICGKIYRQEYTLQQHMSSHTGEKPFSCDVCGLNYTYLKSYLAHLEQHKKDLNRHS